MAGRPATRPPTPLSERESLALVAGAGIAVTEAVAVPDAATAVAVARRIGRPVALKVDAIGLTHKSDLGGVALDLHGDDAVYGGVGPVRDGAARRSVACCRADGARAGADPHLRRDRVRAGRAVSAGSSPFLDDVSIRLAPLTRRPPRRCSTPAGAPLHGVRGRPPVDRGALAACSWRSASDGAAGCAGWT
jgi:acyl-CoA synthetase (NDP forming)